LKSKHQTVLASLNSNNLNEDKKLQELLNTTLGKDGKQDSAEALSIRDPFMEKNQWNLIDPLEVDNLISTLTKEIEGFEVEVDSKLSEINAITKIQID
jgi:hypothetical protein